MVERQLAGKGRPWRRLIKCVWRDCKGPDSEAESRSFVFWPTALSSKVVTCVQVVMWRTTAKNEAKDNYITQKVKDLSTELYFATKLFAYVRYLLT